MARSLTNNSSYAYARETSLGVPSTSWRLVEPNSVGRFGAELTTVQRQPISKDKQLRKGTVTDLDSAVEWEGDLTNAHVIDFVEGFLYADAVHPGGTDLASFAPTSVTGGTQATDTLTLTGNAVADEEVVIGAKTYVWKASVGATANQVLIGADADESLDNLIAAINGGAGSGTLYGSATVAHTQVTAAAGAGDTMDITAIAAGTAGNSIATTTDMSNGSWAGGNGTMTGGTDGYWVVAADGDLAIRTLVYSRGFDDSANNGLFVLASGSTGTNIIPSGSSLVADASPNTNAELEVAGVQGASGDLQINSDGDLISSSLDFTTLDLTVGQWIKIGGEASATKFATAANNAFARIEAIAANKLTLAWRNASFVADTGSSKTIHVYYGRFIRNVAVDHANYHEISYSFEAAYADLGGVGTDMYEYARGNYPNVWTLNLPLADKATCSFTFVGTDTEVPTTSRDSGASSAILPNRTAPYNTSDDIARLGVYETDETGITTYFKSCNISINNNVSAEKTLGNLGATFLNTGNFTVTMEAQVLFTDAGVLEAIRENDTVAFSTIVSNDDDGGMVMDIPSMTLGGGAKSLPQNETILVSFTGTAFKDPTLGYSTSVSLFPYLPA